MSMMRFFGKRRPKQIELAPDEIFIDASNLPAFSRDRFEGRIEAPLARYAIFSVGIAMLLMFAGFTAQLAKLQLVNGSTYAAISESNRIDTVPVFAARGIIYDRNGVELAWNIPLETATTTLTAFVPWGRTYRFSPGFAHLMGYVTLPRKDSSGNYYRTAVEGVAGVEKALDTALSGKNGSRIEESNAQGSVISEGVIEPPVDGTPVYLSIDARLEEAMHESIAAVAEQSGFVGGAAVVMDVHTGELLVLSSYPEYDPTIMTSATNTEVIRGYQDSTRSLFLNRPVAGLYTPGSIIKPFVAIAALAEGVISPYTPILSTGVLRVANPFAPGQYSTFVDWRAHGNVDMRHAIAVSSNIYFYEVGGGYGSQKGVGIANIEKYAHKFGIGDKSNIIIDGEKEGTIPNPTWKLETFDEPWRLGDTYNTAIGQYGFLVTPLQMARAVAALANKGTLLTPSLVKTESPNGTPIEGIAPEHYQVIQEGMRMSVTEGTAAALKLPYVNVAGKTGTAQVGAKKEFVNSWVIGFFPIENPRYSFAVLLERAPAGPPAGAPAAMRKFFDLLKERAPEYVEALP